jgi:hypothetical protein
MSETLWNISHDGAVTAQVGRYRLTVVTVSGMPRFLLHDGSDSTRDGSPSALRASGTAETIAGAMRAAETCAIRRSELLSRTRPSRGH